MHKRKIMQIWYALGRHYRWGLGVRRGEETEIFFWHHHCACYAFGWVRAFAGWPHRHIITHTHFIAITDRFRLEAGMKVRKKEWEKGEREEEEDACYLVVETLWGKQKKSFSFLFLQCNGTSELPSHISYAWKILMDSSLPRLWDDTVDDFESSVFLHPYFSLGGRQQREKEKEKGGIISQ